MKLSRPSKKLACTRIIKNKTMEDAMSAIKNIFYSRVSKILHSENGKV